MASPEVNNILSYFLSHRNGHQSAAPVIRNHDVPLSEQSCSAAASLLTSFLQQQDVTCFNKVEIASGNSSSGRGSGQSSPTAKSAAGSSSSGRTPPTTDDSDCNDASSADNNKSPKLLIAPSEIRRPSAFTVNSILDLESIHHRPDLAFGQMPPYPPSSFLPALVPLSSYHHQLPQANHHQSLLLNGGSTGGFPSFYHHAAQLPYPSVYCPTANLHNSGLNGNGAYPFFSTGSAFTPVAGVNGGGGVQQHPSSATLTLSKSPVTYESAATSAKIVTTTAESPKPLPPPSVIPKSSSESPQASLSNLHMIIDSVASAASSPANLNGSRVGSSSDGSRDSPMSNQSQSNSPTSFPLPANSNAKCLVCDDKASGYHYGVVSCEGCKGFFRRSVQKDLRYQCHKEGKCLLTRTTRNRCQFCRFKKCLDTGMAKESVRQDRNRKRKHQDDEEESKMQATTNVHHVIRTVLQAQNDTMTKAEFEQDQTLAANVFRRISDDSLSKIYRFAQQVPGFTELSQNDQYILKQAACLEILALRCTLMKAQCRNGAVGSLEFDQTLIKTVPHFSFFVNSVNNLVETFRQFNIMEEEVALLSAICLMSCVRSGLEDKITIEKYQEHLLTALHVQMKLRREAYPLTSTDKHYAYSKLMMSISDVRTLSLFHAGQPELFTKNIKKENE